MTARSTALAAPDSLDGIFAALADGGRRSLVERLAIGPASVTDLAVATEMRLPSAVKHLQVLERGGLVVSHKLGRTRTYRIAPDAFAALRAWVGRREAEMNAAFDRLEALIQQTESEGTEP